MVWESDAAAGALLLEAMPSEASLSELRAGVELSDVAELIGALHRSGTPAVMNGVMSLAERVELVFDLWVERYGATGSASAAVPVARLERGRGLARTLAMEDVSPVLLHGDLHPGNVLIGGAGRGLVAIDPRPCVGDAAFDAVDWVFWAAPDPRSWKARSRELAEALDCDGQRLWSWCAAFAGGLAAGRAARGAAANQVDALMALAP
jgi:streptomycin 6-kinase